MDFVSPIRSQGSSSALHFVQSIEPLQGGGLGQAALGLHLAMRETGESTLMCTRAADFHDPSPGVIQGVRKGPAMLYLSPEIQRLAKEEVAKADWVHGHGLYVGTNAIIGREAVRQGKPLCYHVQGFFDPWILPRSRWKKRLAHWLFEDQVFRNVRLWRALTGKEVDQIRAVGIRAPVEVFPNGVRLDEIDQDIPEGEAFSRLPHAERRRAKRILFLARIHPKKGLDLLVAAWAKLAKEFPDWEVAIVGPDEGGYQATVEAMIRENGLDGQMRILPPVSGWKKAAVFRTADLFVLPSYSEGFPVAVLEAAAHRLPSVITTECNFPELAKAGAAWECLPEEESFRESLRLALEVSDAEREQRGELGRELMEASYTWPAIARDLSAACAEIEGRGVCV